MKITRFLPVKRIEKALELIKEGKLHGNKDGVYHQLSADIEGFFQKQEIELNPLAPDEIFRALWNFEPVFYHADDKFHPCEIKLSSTIKEAREQFLTHEYYSKSQLVEAGVMGDDSGKD